jgi:hypothetical protein
VARARLANMARSLVDGEWVIRGFTAAICALGLRYQERKIGLIQEIFMIFDRRDTMPR